MFDINKLTKERLVFIAKNLIMLGITTSIVRLLLRIFHGEYNYYLIALCIGSLTALMYTFASDSAKKTYHKAISYIWLEYFIFMYITDFLFFTNTHIVQRYGQEIAAMISFSSSWFLLLPKPHFIFRWIFAMGFSYGIGTLASVLINLTATDSPYSKIIQYSPDIEISFKGIIYVIGFIIGLVIYNSLTEE